MADQRSDFESGLGAGDGLELRIWLRLLTCTNLLEAEVRQRLKTAADTTLPRFDILAQLERHEGPMSMGELSRRLMVSNGNVTGLVDRLVREGLVHREASATDRRVQMVSLTRDGAAFFGDIAAQHRAWIGEIMSGLSKDEMERLFALLATLKESIIAAEGRETRDTREAAE